MQAGSSMYGVHNTCDIQELAAAYALPCPHPYVCVCECLFMRMPTSHLKEAVAIKKKKGHPSPSACPQPPPPQKKNVSACFMHSLFKNRCQSPSENPQNIQRGSSVYGDSWRRHVWRGSGREHVGVDTRCSASVLGALPRY